MYKRTLWCFLLCALVAACGADGGTDTEQPSSSSEDGGARAVTQNAIPAGEVELQTIVASGVSILFSEFPAPQGDAVIAIRESGSVEVQGGLIGPLLGEHGALSSLEIFYALAPEELTPHHRLVDLHWKEAAAFGRASDTVERVLFDKTIRVDKLSGELCTQSIFGFASLGPGTWGQIGANDNMSGFASTCLNNNPSYFATDFVVAGICNDSSSSIEERNAWDYDGDPWNVTQWRTVGVNGWARWWIPQTSIGKRYCADGCSTTNVDGCQGSGPYHGRAGVFHAQ